MFIEYLNYFSNNNKFDYLIKSKLKLVKWLFVIVKCSILWSIFNKNGLQITCSWW